MAIGNGTAYLCLTLIIKELKISVEHDRVVRTLNMIFGVVYKYFKRPKGICLLEFMVAWLSRVTYLLKAHLKAYLVLLLISS